MSAMKGNKADLVICDGAPDGKALLATALTTVTGLHDLDAYLHSQLLLAVRWFIDNANARDSPSRFRCWPRTLLCCSKYSFHRLTPKQRCLPHSSAHSSLLDQIATVDEAGCGFANLEAAVKAVAVRACTYAADNQRRSSFAEILTQRHCPSRWPCPIQR